MGISPNLLEQLRRVLLECGPIDEDSTLRAIFVDKRLSPWKDRLPEANDRTKRVNSIINFLLNEYNEAKNNALVLLLQVLSEGLEPEDNCHHRLAILATALEHEIKSLEIFKSDDINEVYLLQSPTLRITKPGIFRYLLDRLFPRLHQKLTATGTLSNPPERSLIESHIEKLQDKFKRDLYDKYYVQLPGKQLPAIPPHLITQEILHLPGRVSGGDSASAQIAAVNRQSRLIHNILVTIDKSKDPLILLGEPGSGKTITLKQSTILLIDRELKRVFPRVPLFVRVGEFYVKQGQVGRENVLEYVKQATPTLTSEQIDELIQSERLIIFFDGMDEMSRDRYGEHTEALSMFAQDRRIKTLFTCRIADFSPKFFHERLVLMPFGHTQVTEYLKDYFRYFPIVVDGQSLSLEQLSDYVMDGEFPVDTKNPFALSLLCPYLRENKTWPKSRIELLRFFNEENYQRKEADGIPLPAMKEAFMVWAHFAYVITDRNEGPSIPVSELIYYTSSTTSVGYMIEAGKRCGILVEESEQQYSIRFEHHRFQEYFCAVYIQQYQPNIDWLDKLDAPRWQEVMLNVILLDNSGQVIELFASSIEVLYQEYRTIIDKLNDALAAFQPNKNAKWRVTKNFGMVADCKRRDRSLEICQVCGANVFLADFISKQYASLPDKENELAERTELASRILRQGGSSNDSFIQETLMLPFRDSVSILAKHGNPITQVKILRSCQNVPNIDSIEALRRPLQSKIAWVRNQALILLADTETSTRAIGSNLATEIGYDLASGILPLQLLVYLRAAYTSKKKTDMWALLVGMLCYFMNLLFLFALSVIICFVTFLISSSLDSSLNAFASQLIPNRIYIIVALVTIVNTLIVQPSTLWAMIPGSSAAIVVLSVILNGLWLIRIEGSMLALFAGVVGVLLSGWAIALLTSAIHLTLLTIYLTLTKPLRRPGHHFKGFLLSAWRINQYGAAFRIAGSVLGFVLGIVALFSALFLLLILVGTVVERNAETGNSWINMLSLVILSSPLMYIIFKKHIEIRQRLISFTKELFQFLVYVIPYALAAGFIIIVFALASGSTWWPTIIDNIVRGTLIIILIGTTVWSLKTFWQTIKDLLRLGFRKYPRDSIAPNDWKKLFIRANARKQKDILLRTEPGSLSQDSTQFLSTLKEIGDMISKEPALSTYWELRDQLEEILRQER